MRSFTLMAALVAGVAVGQGIGDINSLPACGKLCISNMLAKAGSLGCSETDIACLCRNVDFKYGIRDCTAAVCSATDHATVVQFGNTICAAATGGAAPSVTQTQSIGTSAVVVSTGTDSAGAAVTTLGVGPLVTTITGTGTTGDLFITTETLTGSPAASTGYTGPGSNATVAVTTASGNSTSTEGTVLTEATASASGETSASTLPTSTSEASTPSSTSKANAAHFAAPGAIGGLAGLILAFL